MGGEGTMAQRSNDAITSAYSCRPDDRAHAPQTTHAWQQHHAISRALNVAPVRQITEPSAPAPDLVRTIEGEVIPRLMMALKGTVPNPAPLPALAPTQLAPTRDHYIDAHRE